MKYTCSQQLRNDAQIKGTQRLKEVNDAIKFINEKFEEFERIGERKNGTSRTKKYYKQFKCKARQS